MVFKFSGVFDFTNARKYDCDVGLLLGLTLESGILFHMYISLSFP